jgi:hypothetical protein
MNNCANEYAALLVLSRRNWSNLVRCYGAYTKTNKPAFSALFVSIDRKLDHPASNTDLANRVRASPLTFNSHEPLRHILTTAISCLESENLPLVCYFLC